MKISALAIGWESTQCPKITAAKPDRFVGSLSLWAMSLIHPNCSDYRTEGEICSSKDWMPQRHTGAHQKLLLFSCSVLLASICWWYCWRWVLHEHPRGQAEDIKMTASSGNHPPHNCCIPVILFERSCACSHFKHNQSQCTKV